MARIASFLVFILLLPSVTAFGKPKKVATKSDNSRLERYLTKVYLDADADHDGWLNLDECYEMVLRLYVQINQQAPIDPPSRVKVAQFLSEADTNHNNKLSREEFSTLAKLLYGRAAVRLATYKIVTLGIAPLSATYLAHRLGENKKFVRFLRKVVNRVIPVRAITDRLFHMALGRTLLIISFMATLGDLVLALVDTSLDMYHLPDPDAKEKKQKRP